MFETMVAGLVAFISVSHVPFHHFDIYSPLLAHWASHTHYSLSFLSPCSHFSLQDRGPLVRIHYLGVSWALDLGARFSYYIFLSLHHCIFITLHRLCYSSHLLYSTCCLFCTISFHPEWWSSSVHYMEGSHIISTIYPMDTDLGILSLRRLLRQREFMLH